MRIGFVSTVFAVALVQTLAFGQADARPRRIAITAGEKKAAKIIRPESLRAHIRFLASDLLEGRGPATRGDRLAQTYIATQMERIGLLPGAPGGGWYQSFDIVGVTSHCPEVLTLKGHGKRIDLRFYSDYIAFSGVQQTQAHLDNAEIVFVGYGIVAPKFGWDDYKGADLKGKVLLMMNNDPEDDPALFAGKTRLYFGRWTYKYEIAAEKGAAGAIIIHTTPSAGYGWQVVQTSWTGEGFSLPHTGGPQLQVQAWVTEDTSKRIARLAGKDLDVLRAAARKRDFKPVPLGVTVDLVLKNDIQNKQTANVIGRLPGRDRALGEQAVVYTAHHDHLGMKKDAKPGEDAVYNGAIDNATGVASVLAIAEAMAALPRPPRRSVLFVAVAGEEQGLLGSQYFAAHPTVAAGRLAANINIDALGMLGRTRDIIAIGLGKSDLDHTILALAKTLGRKVLPDQFPDRGTFYRSDQFNMAKIGVPAAYLNTGIDVIGKPKGWGKQQREAFVAEHYHQTSDEFRDDWDFSGAVEDTRLLFYLGLKLANASRMPNWNVGDEFEAARKAALRAAAQ